MSDMRKKDTNWNVCKVGDTAFTWEGAQLAVLMDLRDELKKLNGLLCCTNFLRIPRDLWQIRLNTTKAKRVKK